MKSSLTPDVLATTMGLALALAVLSVPLASADSEIPLGAPAEEAPVLPTAEKDDSDDDLGEASYNVEDCEPANDDAEQGVESKELEECKRESK